MKQQNSSGNYSSGDCIVFQRIRYTAKPGIIKVIRVKRAHTILIIHGLIPRYSAIPPHTPPRYRSFARLRFIAINYYIHNSIVDCKPYSILTRIGFFNAMLFTGGYHEIISGLKIFYFFIFEFYFGTP